MRLTGGQEKAGQIVTGGVNLRIQPTPAASKGLCTRLSASTRLVNPHDGYVYTLPFVPHLGHFHRVLVICVSYQCIKDPFPHPAFAQRL